VAISDSKGGIYNKDGLNIPAVLEYKEKNNTLAGFPDAKEISNQELLELPVDVLVPAALDNQITMENAPNIRAWSIVEMANGPTSSEADAILHEKGITVVPDVLANAGGVTVSYFEWDQNLKGIKWSEEEVFKCLKPIMADSFNAIWETKEKYHIDLRTAAFVRAIERIKGKM